MRSQLEPKFEMSQRHLFIGLLVLSLNIVEIYSQSEKDSQVLIDSIGIKPMTQNVSYYLSSFSNQKPTTAITTSVQVFKSLSSSKPSVTFKSSLISESSATSSILLSSNIKDENILLLRTTSTPTTTTPLSSEFILHRSSITLQAFSPTRLSLPSIVYFTTSREAMMETVHVEPTPSHTISLSPEMTITRGHLIHTSMSRSMSRGIERSATVRESSVQSTSVLTSTVVIITSFTSSVSVDSNPQITGTEAEETTTTRARTPIATSGVTIPAAIGVVVAGTLVLVSLALFILLVLCYCFRRSRKYEYSTGNEYRVTVQKWNAQFTHYTVNQCESLSSSRGSSLLSIWSSNGMKPRLYGGISSAADHLHSVAHFEMYSTPL